MDHQDLHFPETENIGNLERIIRTAIGVLMIEAALAAPSASMGWLIMAALYPVFTAIIGWDPVYALFRHAQGRPAATDTSLAPHLNNNPQQQAQQESDLDKAA